MGGEHGFGFTSVPPWAVSMAKDQGFAWCPGGRVSLSCWWLCIWGAPLPSQSGEGVPAWPGLA